VADGSAMGTKDRSKLTIELSPPYLGCCIIPTLLTLKGGSDCVTPAWGGGGFGMASKCANRSSASLIELSNISLAFDIFDEF
jgi:hypothetical protein